MSDLHLPCAIKAINSVLLQQALGRVSSLLCSSILCTWSFQFPLCLLFSRLNLSHPFDHTLLHTFSRSLPWSGLPKLDAVIQTMPYQHFMEQKFYKCLLIYLDSLVWHLASSTKGWPLAFLWQSSTVKGMANLWLLSHVQFASGSSIASLYRAV